MITAEVFGLGAAAVGAAGWWAARASIRQYRADADRFAGLVVTHPARGLPARSGRILDGEPLMGLLGPDPRPEVHPAPVVVSATVTTAQPALPPASAAPTCGGTLLLHEDGHTTCHGGQPDCWPGIGPVYRHRPPVPCGQLSHGCGTCTPALPGGAR